MLNSVQSPKKEIMSRNYGGKEPKCCIKLDKKIYSPYISYLYHKPYKRKDVTRDVGDT